jgi:protein-L-isoaspartate O-methyltransferase
VGIETDGEVLAAAHERLAGLADTARLTLLHAADANAALAHGPYDRVYATFAYTSPVAALLPLVVGGGLVQVPRPVLAHELAREPLLRPERERYGTFERFFESWQSNLCLTTYRREGERLRVVDKLYAVQFVGQRDEVVPAPGARRPATARC